MSSVARKLLQVQPSAADDTGDDDFANVVLLLDGDGTSGDDNNTFTDSGSLGGTVTESGDVVQGSFSPYGDNWSVYFENDTAFMQSDTGIDVASSNFTIEMWVWVTANDMRFCSQNNTGSTNFFLGTNTSGNLAWDVPTGNDIYSTSASGGIMDYVLPLNQWVHVAAVREGTGSNQLKMYADGVLVAQGTDSSGHGTGRKINIAGGRGNNANYDGYISNFRFVVGSAVYTSAFTPPTAPLTNITNTKLLACQSNRFIDNSSTGDTFTLNLDTGLPKVTPFSPFKDDDARDITTDGGSANFNQNDLLTIADNSALDVSGAMTAEAWIYVNDFPDGNVGATGQGFVITRWVASGNQRSWGIFLGNNGQISFYVSNTGGASYTISSSATGAIGQHQWHHIAISWDGSNQRLFIDGDLKVTTANTSGPFSTASAPFCANALNTNLTGSNMDMYIADARYFPDKCLYTASFAVPTAPLGNLAGTENTLNNVEYENKSFSVVSQETNPQGVRFKSDGTKMYVVGNTGNDVMQYSLSTAWDVSTASFDSVTLSVGSQDGTPNGLAFSSDGTKLYITGNVNNRIFQYDLSTAWDLSTASYASKSLLTSTAAGSGPIEPFMRSNGTDFYYLDNDDDTVYQYTLSTANDISTASYASKSVSVASQETTPTGLTFSSDGTKMFVCGQVGDDVNQYTLSTAWDVSTASFDNIRFAFNTQAINPAGIDLKPDGTKLYMISNAGDAVYQYNLTSSVTPTVLLNFQDAGIYDRTGINNLDTVGNAQIDTAVVKYGTGSIEFDGTGDGLSSPETTSFGFGSGDFTIEAWAYLTTNGVFNNIVSAGVDSANGYRLDISTSNNLRFLAYIGSWTTVITGSTSLATGQWYHLAVTRNGNNFNLWVDGSSDATTVSNSGTIADPTTKIEVGAVTTNSLNRSFNGYLDDVRVTKGIARYTSNFTAPTAAHGKF